MFSVQYLVDSMMKRTMFFFVFLAVLSCKKQNEVKLEKEEDYVVVEEPIRNELKLDTIEKESLNSFFKSVDSVRLISFPSKMVWGRDKIIKKNTDDAFQIPKEKIIDNVIVNDVYLNKITKILETDVKNGTAADCYEPRHLLQFYTKGKIIGYYELCLECGGYECSNNLNFLPPFCIEKGEVMKKLFERMKLKNTGEGSKVLDKFGGF